MGATGAALALILGAGSAGAATNLLTNGSFETGDFSGWTVLNTMPSPNSALVTTNLFDGDEIIKPEDGKFEAVFEGFGGPEISQTFSDAAGEELEVSVWYAFTDPDPELTLIVAGTLHELPFVKTGAFQEFHFVFKATGSDTLQIDSIAASTEAANVVDNLSIEPFAGVSETPEASTWAMMIVGFASLGFIAARSGGGRQERRRTLPGRPVGSTRITVGGKDNALRPPV